jgi:uncharacterized membrane protein
VTSVLRLAALKERLRASLWLWPSVSVGLAFAVGTALPLLELRSGSTLGFAGTAEGARSVLATVAGSMITVTGLTFSLTVLALQMASTQFTPRLLRTFLSDGGNQAVLSVFLGTFTYTLAVLRSIRNPVDGEGSFVPDIAVTLGMVLTLMSVGMLVYFFHHLTQQLRVETVLGEVQADTIALIESLYDEVGQVPPVEPPPAPDGAIALPTRRSGYLQAVDTTILLRVAEEAGASLRIRPTVGIHVTQGSTIAWAWPVSGQAPDRLAPDELAKSLHEGLQIGPERTLQQDVAFGLRQLVDIAARALSPGVNDPTTAVATLHAMAPVLGARCGRQMGTAVERGEGGVAVILPRSSFADLLGLAVDQPRRYGRDEPAVLTVILRILTDLAEVAVQPDEREAVRREIEATADAAAEADLSALQRDLVEQLAGHARAAVDVGHRVPVRLDTDDGPAP